MKDFVIDHKMDELAGYLHAEDERRWYKGEMIKAELLDLYKQAQVRRFLKMLKDCKEVEIDFDPIALMAKEVGFGRIDIRQQIGLDSGYQSYTIQRDK